jgi:hypothetical protein
MFIGASRWPPQTVIRHAAMRFGMAKKTIPKNAGQFHVGRSALAGNFLVMNDRTGKNQILIPCTSQAQAEEYCRRLNEGDHNGEINVPNRIKRH